MAVPLVEKTAAVMVIDHLNEVRAKWKQKQQLYLPGFLEVAPGAPYEEWMSQLKKRSRHFKNRAGVGHDQATILCTLLENGFKNQESWRGLLNTLGQVLVETDVEQFAGSEERGDPHMVKQYLDVWTHRVRSVVGAPDAELVVKDLLRKSGVKLPKPQPKPSRQAEPEPPRQPPPQQTQPEPRRPQLPEPAPESLEALDPPEKPSFWQSALSAVAQGIRNHIEEEVRIQKETVNVAGTWQADGAWVSMTQLGSLVYVQGYAFDQSLRGQGTIRGRKLQLGVTLLGQNVRLSVLLEVAPDNHTMKGTASDVMTGKTVPVLLHK